MNGIPLWQADEVIRLVRGQTLHEQSWSAWGVSCQGGKVKAGDLFVALDNHPSGGHDCVAEAFAAGAAAALVKYQPRQVSPEAPLIFVDDVAEALFALAERARERSRAKVIAVTGSIGKTCVKEMLRLALGAVGRVFVETSRHHDALDLALSLANMPMDVDCGVFEVGLSFEKDLAPLSALLAPDVLLVTAIEPVHLDLVETLDGVLAAKASLLRAMSKKSMVIVNRDMAQASRFAAAVRARGIKNLLSYSVQQNADAVLKDCAPDDAGSRISLYVGKRELSYRVGAPGWHHVLNSMAVLLTVQTLGGGLEEAAGALSFYVPVSGCGAMQTLDLPDGGSFCLIDERGSSCPASMRAALDVLARQVSMPGGRKFLVFSDMPKLGALSPEWHMDLAPVVAAIDGVSVFCCGDMARYLFDILPEKVRGSYAEDLEELAAFVAAKVQPNDIVSVVGTEESGQSPVVDALLSLGVMLRPQEAIA